MTPPPGRRVWILALALVGLALVVRLGAVAATPDYAPRTDDRDFDRIALAIARGDGYAPAQVGDRRASAFRPPAYAYALGAVYALAGTPGERTRWTLARVGGAALGAVTVALVGVIAWLALGAAAAVAALAIAALYPPLVIPSTTLLSESLFIPLVLAAVAAVLVHRRGARAPGWLVAAGILTGLAALTRSNGILVLGPLLATVWWSARATGSASRAVAALLVPALVVMVPWTVRNAVRFDAFVPVTTQDGFGLAGTYNPQSRAFDERPASWRPPSLVPAYREVIERPDLSEADVSRILRERAVEFMADDPGYVLRVCYWNLRRMLHTRDPIALERQAWGDYGVHPRLSDAGVLGSWIVMLLALAGVATGAARRAPRFVWAVPVLLVAPAIPISVYMRYRLPADPFLVLLASVAVAAATGALGERRRAR